MNPVIVLGMHRSGTSAIARLVQQLGVDVGTNLLAATDGNIYGHFEEAAFIVFHDALIARLYPRRAPFCEWLPLAESEITYTEAERAEAKSLWETHQATGGSGWKDPRTSLFLDLWMDILPEARVIVCLRHPYQVHRSLLRRGEPFLHVDYSAAITGWNIYNQRILQVISRLPKERVAVVDVETGFPKPRELADGLARFLELPLSPNAFEAIDPEAFHFEDDFREALENFETYLPAEGATYRKLRELDFLHPPASPTPTCSTTASIRSNEARLIEFEESHGLRSKAKKMLIRSIAVDRQRTIDFYQHVAKAGVEKDRLIEDLSRFAEQLKIRLAEQEKLAADSAGKLSVV
jgi:hypothetical protein